MTPKDVINYFGGKPETANALDISYEAVRKWELSGVVPRGRQCEIQIKTNGYLKADIEVASQG